MLVIKKRQQVRRYLLVDSQGDGRALLETDGSVVTEVVQVGEGEAPDEWDEFLGMQQRFLNSSYMTAYLVPNTHKTLERPTK